MAGVWMGVTVATSGDSSPTTEPAPVNAVVTTPPRDDSWTDPLTASLALSLPSIKVIAGGETTMAAGVVFDSDGHILTSAGAVGEADAIFVLGADGSRSRARLVGADSVTDMAIVRTDREDLVPASFALTRRTRAGQYALTRSHTGETSPDGRVVALSTSVSSPTGEMLHEVLAFSSPRTAPIPGAGVFDDAGEIFAVTTSATAVSAERMGHAIPAAIAVPVANELIATGHAVHPWLGVQGTDLPPERAAALGTPGGASITAVASDGPAAAAGMMVGDTVVSASGQTVDSMAGLVRVLRDVGGGAVVDLQVVRAGSLLTLSAVLVDR